MSESTTSFELSTSRARAAIDLEGGRLAGLKVDGLELLVPPSGRPTRWGSFPMIPWCGRLPDGRLEFEGTTYQFPITSPPHANHGRTHLQPWERVEVREDQAIISTALVDPWTLGGGAVQRFVLTESSLTITAEVHATQPMPAMIGWHPWFRRELDTGRPAELHFVASSYYVTDADDIPTGERAPLVSNAYKQRLNTCITGMREAPRITWPDALAIRVTSTLDHWVVFTEPERALCVEPQSGPPNQVNTDPVLATEAEPLIGSMTISWGH